jgi:hypothetical protein
MAVQFANNAYATLAAGIASSDTSITLTSGQGARFPSLSGSDHFYATLIDTSNNLEIVKVTARATDVLTVTRGQESTTARAFVAGDRIELRITAAGLVDATTIANDAITNAMIATDAVNADSIAANSVGASELNVSGNGTSGQALLSDGDGTFSWGDGAKIIATHTATYSTRTGLSGTASRVVFWDALTFTKQRSNSKLRISINLPFGGAGDTYPHFGTGFVRLSTTTYSSNGSDLHGYITNTRATTNNFGAMYTADFLYDTTGTNVSGTGSVYVSIGYNSANAGTIRPAPIWNPNAVEDARGHQSISTIIIDEII